MASFLDRAASYPWLQKTKQVFDETPAEVHVGIAVGFMALAMMRHDTLEERAGEIPLAFSEIGQTIREFKIQGRPVPPLTHYLSVLNDSLMQPFEANNIAFQTSSSNETFARELEFKTDRAFRVHTLFTTHAEKIPALARDALQSIHKLVEAAHELPAINAELDKAWEDHHHDVTHTVYDDVRVCDNREVCHTEKRPREVYDYTIHTYTYNSGHGENAATLLNAFMKKHPDLHVDEHLHYAKSTQADNEYAIESSRRRQLKGKLPTPEEYLQYANSWASGSTLTKYEPIIESNHSSLKNLAVAWTQARQSAESTTYRTNFQFDDGPRAFQVVEEALKYGQSVQEASGKIVGGFQYAAHGIPALATKIEEFIHVTLDRKDGDADKLRDEIMHDAKDIYAKNFENGFNVETMSWLSVFLFGLMGGAGGGLLGAGVDHYRNIKRENRPFFSRSPDYSMSSIKHG